MMKTTEKFTEKADIYSKYRPGYPEEYIRYLITYNNLGTGSTVADIGSGTGILTGQLLDKGLNVTAVEPNSDMRSSAEKLLSNNPRFRSINGTAENTGIPGQSIDLITVAQAFHWFDKAKFKTECRRILKPGLNVALVWNSRDSESALVRENGEILRKLCPLFNGFSGGIDETPGMFAEFFRDGKFNFKVFENNIEFDLYGFIGRNLSSSYAPKKTDAGYQKFIEAITGLFEKYSKSGKLIMPNFTRSYIGKV